MSEYFREIQNEFLCVLYELIKFGGKSSVYAWAQI